MWVNVFTAAYVLMCFSLCVHHLNCCLIIKVKGFEKTVKIPSDDFSNFKGSSVIPLPVGSK